jgi:hypothetical protein
MDHQSMQSGGGGGGSGAATQEWLYPGAGGGGPQAFDRTFLMELLEDAPATEQPQEDVDQLKRVIQSLEVEIDGRPPADGGSKTAEHVPADDDVDGGMLLLDDMLSADLHSSPGPCMAAEAMTMPPFEYCWAPEVPVGHDMGGWYLDGDGILVEVGEYEFREQCYYGYGESQSLAVDQVYIPLWE